MSKRKKRCKNLQRMVKNLYKGPFTIKDFEVSNGVLGLERDIYLSIVKFLDSSIVRKVSKYFIYFIYFVNSFS
jgi:hypothetical protein